MRLRLGIQSKLVITLMLAGLLPLLLSLIVLLIAVFQLRVRSVGESFRAFARQDADNLGTLLSAQIELADVFSELPGTVEVLTEANRTLPSDPEDIARIEETWPSLPETDPLVQSVVTNRIANQWRSVREQRMRFAEVLVTDATGRLVAATNKTSDYFQADEAWWQTTRDNSPGMILVEDARWDPSARLPDGEPGLLVINVCIPIVDPTSSAFLGAMKVALDVGWLAEHVQTLNRPSGIDNRIALMTSAGVILGAPRPSTTTATTRFTVPITISPDALELMKTQRSGWITQKDVDDDVIGFARLDLSDDRVSVEQTLNWYVVIAASRAETLKELRRLIWLILAAGLLTIAACFIIGLYVARREIVAPLLALRRGVDEFGRGNINYRLPVGTEARSFREDEIGAVAEAFNRMADELRATVRRLEQAGLLKQQFIDVASHELRTPVTYILGAAQLAERQAAAGGGESILATKISSKARRLSRIVDNMMKLLNDDRFDSALHLGMVDLRAIIDTACQEVAPFMNERGQKCQLEIPANFPPVRADAEKLKDVILNLLSNAVRFSPDGSTITLAARLSEKFVEIDVIDAGTGIAAEDLPHLFEPFATPQRSTVMRHTSGEYGYNTRGLGLGLSVVRRFVELHGGTVSVETSEHGTRMRVRLPTHQPAQM